MQPIAIIGASCRFPGATGLDEFWELLREGRNAVSTVPKERWDPDALYDSDPDAAGKITTRYGGFLKGIREFDCAFFGISPREAGSMDPQQRLLLETAYEAFENAGLPMDLLAGSNTAVYVGIGPGDYGRMCVQQWDRIDAHYATGNFLSIAADRIPYFFDLRGPSMAVDTACSSSLVAVHLACRSIECGEATLALAGGVNALLSPPLSISLGKAGALSPTGRCRAFDANADGYVRGEGAGFVVLKRLEEAISDRDRIYAVIRGSAINQSGRRNGLTAPGSWGEENVMLTAWRSSGIAPAQADYIEAHGTGTVLGDAIEASALGKVVGNRDGRALCRIGSVKTNFGHLETAAGIAGLIKTILMIWHGQFVPSLYPETPNPHVDLEQLGLTVQKRTETWPSASASLRVAGVSSFGLGGTYAHVCVTSPPRSQDTCSDVRTGGVLVPVSARHPIALRLLVREMARLFDKSDLDQALEICRAAARRRKHLEYRVAFAGLSSAEVALAMDWWLQESQPEGLKLSVRRRLVVVVSETHEFDNEASDAAREFGAVCDPGVENRGMVSSRALLSVLLHWGIRPHRVLRLADGHLTALSTLEDGDKESIRHSEIELEEAKSAGDDFLDLTRENFVAQRVRLAKNGAVLTGFSLSEPPKLTMLRLAAELYGLRYPVAWQNIYPGTAKQVTLPPYPWQHQTCWWESADLQTPRSLQSSAAVKKPAPSSPSNSSLPSLLARITGRPLQEIEPDASPTELGIDSLMTIELQDELKCQFGVSLPIETLVKVGSVRDLERLIGESSESAAPRSEQGPAQPLAQSEARSPTEIREAARGDYEQIAALTCRNGLEIKPREEWEHLWVNNPVYKKVPNWPIGWVVRNGTEIVGFLGNIPVSYHFKGREIIGASLHAFTLDSSHRGYGLLLLNRLLECGAAVEYLVGSTANANSSKVLERTGIAHVPTGDWENSVFWITNYAGFLNSALTRRGWPKLLAYPGSTALDLRDKFLKRSWPRQNRELHPCSAFDERFDVFWEELKRAYPHRFLATRSREVLDWHFKYAHAQNRAWILTVEEGSRIVAYGILYRHDNREINLKRIRLIDFQTINGDNEILVSMLAWGLRKCREEGIHMLEAFGFRPDKQRVIDRWAQYRRRLPGWLYFYKAPNQSLHQELQDPNVWDPSQFDGDASL